MRLQTFVLLSLMPFVSLSLGAQEVQQQGFCGTQRHDLDAITELLKDHLVTIAESSAEVRSGAITYVPIKLHVVQRNDGTGGVELEHYLDMLCGMNEFYDSLEIQFYTKGAINYIKNTGLFDNPMSTASYNTMVNNRLKGSLNIFLTNETGDANVLAYYSSGWPSWESDLIVIRRSDVASNKYTIEHELGHYFTLPHTFNGWECDPYNVGKHGNPVTLTTAPCSSSKPPFNNIPVELADGSNSTTAGDFLTDTPADYNFGLGWDDCNYNDGAKDKNNVLLNPDEKNVMGYFLFCPNYYFSALQKLAIKADLNTRKNALPSNNRYLNVAITPELDDPGIAAAIFPIDGGISNGNVDVKLEWQADAGAKSYIVRIDRFTSFKFQPHYYYVNTPEVTLDFELIENAKYYWQVFSYNEYRTCSPWSPIFSFNASLPSAVTPLNGLVSFALHTQPLQIGQPLFFQAAMSTDAHTDLTIFDLNGRMVYAGNNILLSSGDHQYNSGWTPVQSGVYVIRLQNETGIITEKLIVQ